VKYWTVHLDNTPFHNSTDSRESLEATGAIRVPHPPSSADIAPSEFHFFDNLKQKLRSAAVTDGGGPISVITQIFSDIPQSEFIAVEQNWTKRLCLVIKNGGLT
jgi:hypothetical protein